MPFIEPQGVPLATYRLQLRKEFPFAAAAEIVPYLRALGVSHCYCSPVLMSAPGSTHGYDVNDYHRIDTELGGPEGFAALATTVRANRMGILLDFVPNHMGIEGSQNRWWQDVLECGPRSPHADFFDVDWRDPYRGGEPPRVLVPILADHYGVVLEAGRLALECANGTFALRYEGMRFPVSPATASKLLAGAAEQPGCAEPARRELRALADAFHALASPERGDRPIERAPRLELKQRLAKLTQASAEARDAIARELDRINGHAGEPRSFDELDGLIGEQSYRLAHWKTGAHEVNYRRFFAIDTLIGLRMENPRVFEETHRLVGGLVRQNLIAGLRIDHIDGLRNPLEYLERVQALAVSGGVAASPPFYVVVEKILAEGEELDRSWPAHGTTGYEFIRQLGGLFVDPAAEGKFTRLFREFTGEVQDFGDLVYAEKRLVLEEMFANAVTQLAHELAGLVAADRRWRDLTRYELTVAIREIVACLGVYRIYRRMSAECRTEDAHEVDRACAEAIRRNPRRDAQPFEFVRDLLVGRYPPPSATVEFRAGLWRWVLTFQQYTGAVMAKAVEDTAFYIYNRFIALNEVGGNPATFGRSMAEFHAECARRRALTPHTLLATSTHDTKLGEDARARLYVLSEIPETWGSWVGEWRELNRRHKTSLAGVPAPDANEEYRFYQTLVACWPAGDAFAPDEEFRARLREHMRKALNEAKRNTHWMHPNEPWLEACDRFVNALLAPETGGEFLASFGPKVHRVAQLGVVNALAQLTLKITSPGVPDFYQGCENWNLSLVDPDNRRLVAWAGREAFAGKVADVSWPELLRNWPDAGVKVRLTTELLRLRREHLAVFQQGDYEPVTVTGEFAERVVAFRRCHGRECIVVVVPRLTASLGYPPLGSVWGDTTLVLPKGWARWRDALSAEAAASGSGTGDRVPVAEVLRELPVAVLLGT
ncbi:MAG TPA: malto-oligosyltrehalose synthase [Opitutaceae bacterium]|nr:malto-oligosyltrehalose synthase [Opitutaceae bacterium]